MILSSRAVKILFLSFTCEDIGIAMVTNMISQLQESFPLYYSLLLSLFLLYNFMSEFHNIFMIGILRWVTTSELHYFAVSKMKKKVVFYVGISSVSIK